MHKKHIYTFYQWKNKIKKKLKIKTIFKLYREKQLFSQGFDVTIKFKKSKLKRYLTIHKRGVQIVPIVFCTSDKKYYTIMVKQFRIGTGRSTLEFPSGSVEKKESYLKAAKRELYEELNIKKTKLIKLFSPIPIQPVNTNLICQFFCFKLRMNLVNLKKLNNLKTGVHNDYEFCKTKVVRLKKLNKMYMDSSIIGLKLVENKFNLNKKLY